MQTKKMSQRERSAKHRAAHPQDEALRKERQRDREGVLLFHIKRRKLYAIPLPNHIDPTSAAFQRMERQYDKQCRQHVEVVEGNGEENENEL